MTDILIAGAGPAGVSAAIVLSRAGKSVCLASKGADASDRVGECLLGSASVPLTRIGVWDAFLAQNHLRSSAILSSWGTPDLDIKDSILDPYGGSWQLDRAAFDQMLIDRATSAGARVATAKIKSCALMDDSWHAVLATQQGETVIKAKFLIDATGRSAALARNFGAERRTAANLVCLYAFFSSPESAEDTRVLVEASEHGWWYTSGLPGNRIIACFFTLRASLRTLKETWTQELPMTLHVNERLAGSHQESEFQVRSANSYLLEPAAGCRWMAIGDAAMAVDPLTSSGIALALESGIQAAKSIEQTTEPEFLAQHEEELETFFDQYLGQRRFFYSCERRWPRSEFWVAQSESPKI